MAPFSSAIKTSLASIEADSTRVYAATCDIEWSITVPHGGYILSLVMDALLAHQLATGIHPDPLHLSAQFLSPSSIGPLIIRIKTYSTTKRLTRLDVQLLQADSAAATATVLRISAHAIFGSLPSLPSTLLPPGPANVTIMPATPSDYATLCPLLIHPSEASITPMHPDFAFKDRIQWAEGVEKGVDEAAEQGRKKMEWGCWFEMKDSEEDIRKNASFIPFFADMFKNGPETLPPGLAPAPSWFPTLTLAIDFKSKFPLPTDSTVPYSASTKIAPRTVGLYATSAFVHDGRHDERVEVWSAPCGIGGKTENGLIGGSVQWRKECRILAVSTQMALVIASPARTSQAKM